MTDIEINNFCNLKKKSQFFSFFHVFIFFIFFSYIFLFSFSYSLSLAIGQSMASVIDSKGPDALTSDYQGRMDLLGPQTNGGTKEEKKMNENFKKEKKKEF